MSDVQPDVYTHGAEEFPSHKLDKIDPLKLKLRELAAVEKMVGHKLADELQSGDMGIDVMQGFLWVMLCRRDGIRISAADVPDAAVALITEAEEIELEELMELFEDEDDGSPPASLAGPDPT